MKTDNSIITTIKVFLWIYTVLFAFLTISSVAPFKSSVEFYIGANLDGFYDLISTLPFIGRLFLWMTINGLYWIIALLVCVVFNFFETILFIRTLSRRLTLIELTQYGSYDKIQINSSDDAFAKKLKKTYNNIPESLFKAFLNIGLFLGGLDIAIHWNYYQVIQPGGFVNVGEFIRGLGSLLWVEMFCYTYIVLYHYIAAIKMASNIDQD